MFHNRSDVERKLANAWRLNLNCYVLWLTLHFNVIYESLKAKATLNFFIYNLLRLAELYSTNLEK